MALKRWAWLGATLVAMALAAIVVLPPRPVSLFGSGWIGPEDTYYSGRGSVFERTLDATRQRLRNGIEARRREGSILAARGRPGALHTSDCAITVLREASLSEDSARVWLNAVHAELDAFPRAAALGIPIVVVIYTSPVGRQVAAAGNWYWSERRWLSTSGARPACVVELNLAMRRTAWNRIRWMERDSSGAVHSSVLDWCALYGRYGMPGEAVSRWSATLRGPSRYWGGSSSLERNLAAARRNSPPRALFENPQWYRTFMNDWNYQYRRLRTGYRVTGCVRGDGGLCRAVLGLTEGVAPREEPDWYGWGGNTSGLSVRELIAHLLANEGGERFLAFWQSPLQPGAALEAAYARPTGDMLVAWAQRRWTRPQVGPHAPGRLLVAGLGWMVFALVLGVVIAKRQTVEF